MSYLALYRKYRPKTFEEVVGQKTVKEILTNQIKSDKIGHAYLFCGTRGTGKTSIAKIFAKAINCTDKSNVSPCNNCEACKTLEKSSLDIVEMDAASNNGVDDIRDLREQTKYPPVVGKYKVYIIDEVHMLTTQAFNALLKTLEEPPKYVVFILATTEPHKVPATILSRCMRLDFKLVSDEGITELLKRIFDDSKIKYEEKALQLIARAGEGSVRDALSIADMAVSYSGDNLTYKNVIDVVGSVEKDKLSELATNILEREIGKSLQKLDEILSEGKNPLVLSKDLISYFRDLVLIYTLGDDSKKMVVVPDDIYLKMKAQASKENYKSIISVIENLSTVEQELRYSVHPKIVFETSIIKSISDIGIENRLEVLEKQMQEIVSGKKKINSDSNQIAEDLSNTEIKSADQNLDAQSCVTKTKEADSIKKDTIFSKNENSETELDENIIFGELLRYLKQNKNMFLYSAFSEILKIKIKDNKFFALANENTISMLNSEKENIKVLDDFFEKYNLQFIVRKNIEPNELLIEDLKKLFGEKLIVE